MAVSRRNRKSEEDSTPNPGMDLSKIKDIIKLMEDHELTAFELEQDGFKVKLEKGGQLAVAAPAPAPAAIPAAAPETPADAVVAEPTEEITSPRVGTFYKASDPESDAFVKVGDAVDEETTVCIIEAMKVMNPIVAEKSGTVTAILVEDAEPVEFHQPLATIE